jgi:predicted phosphoribosyltransferase
LRPERLWAISQFYADFKQVDDAVVLELLRAAAACRPSKEG